MKSTIFRDIIKSIAITITLLQLSSCDLNEYPSSFVGPEEYYQTEAQCISGLNASYIPIASIYSYTFMIMTEATTDLMFVASGTEDAQLDISPAKPLYGQTVWTQCYKGIMYANAVIAGIERSPLDEETKGRLKAEGVVVRSFYYWLLTCTFGDVPFYTCEVDSDETMLQIAKLGRMSAHDTRDALIAELQEYVPYLASVRSSEVADNRMGRAMGLMMIGKLAQWNKEWQIAIDACSELEDIYGDLSQYSLEDVMFRYKNTPESIFEIQHIYVEGGLTKTTNIAAICTPMHNGGGVFDGVEIPEIGDKATTWTSMRPNSYFFQALQTRNGGDKRTKNHMAWEYNGVPFKSVGTRPWIGPKFWCLNMQNTADSNNHKVFRYADALLMLAECYAELDNEVESVRYLNMVRQRADITDYTYRSSYALKEEIQKERGRELLGEFQRKFDLVRWGIWYQMTYDYTDYATLKNNIKPCHEYYPIPDKEVIYSGGALDNDAYKAYGL